MNTVNLALFVVFVLLNFAACKSSTAVAWGFPAFGGSASGVNLNDVASVACGGFACVAIKLDGTAVTWGDAYAGGDSSSVDLTHVITAMCGGWACVALNADSTLVSWGGRRYEYMDSKFVHFDNPNGVSLTNVASAMCAAYECIAVKHDGTIAVWGRGRISGFGLTNVASAMCNDDHICIAVKHDGTVEQWYAGFTFHKSLEILQHRTYLTNVASATCGKTCAALTHDRTVLTWGGVLQGPAVTIHNVSSSMCGGFACIAVKDDGRVLYWGLDQASGDFSYLGDVSNAVTATCGGFACVVVTVDDVAMSFGRSVSSTSDGHLEYGEEFYHEVGNVASAMCGTFACVAVKRDGTASTWGASHFGGDASQVTLTNVVSAMCGDYACVAITTHQAPTEAPTSSAGGFPRAAPTGVALGTESHTHTFPHDDFRAIKELGFFAMCSILCLAVRAWLAGQVNMNNKTSVFEVGPVSLLEDIEMSSYSWSLAPARS